MKRNDLLALLLFAVTTLGVAFFATAETNSVPMPPCDPPPMMPAYVPDYDAAVNTNVVAYMTKTVTSIAPADPKTMTIKVTVYESLTTNAIYEASFTSPYRKHAFMKTEIIEE